MVAKQFIFKPGIVIIEQKEENNTQEYGTWEKDKKESNTEIRVEQSRELLATTAEVLGGGKKGLLTIQ